MNTRIRFTALLTYVSEKEGGSPTPSSSGYRIVIRFAFDPRMRIATPTFTDTDLVFPGDTVTAEITLIDSEGSIGKLYQGMDFEFFSGDTLIGTGVIIKL